MARTGAAPSPASQSLVAEIRRRYGAGFSIREIARQTELSKSHVHNIVIGKRGVSAARAATATERLSREQPALLLTEGNLRSIDPLNKRERQKLGRYMRAVKDAKRASDFRDVRRRFKRTVIRTTEGEFHVETDPAVLAKLDDAGILDIDEVFHYEPTKPQ